MIRQTGNVVGNISLGDSGEEQGWWCGEKARGPAKSTTSLLSPYGVIRAIVFDDLARV